MSSAWKPRHFIGEAIAVEFDQPPLLSKKPTAPQRFIWDGEVFDIVRVESTWFDYGRRGAMARNMAPAHLKTAETRGSWGVGRTYFRVVTQGGRAFDLYYDRAPRDAGDRAGQWYLWRELVPIA
jgi:hypothetical protein